MIEEGCIVGVVALALAGCDPAPTHVDAGATTDAGASPNASILPAPLATESPEIDAGADSGAQGMLADSAGRLTVPDASAPSPEVMRPDLALPAETPASKDLAGVTLEGAWRWRDVPGPPKAPEVGLEAIREAQKLTALTWKIDLTDSGRMRIEFTSRALPLPAHSEIRARADRYGNIVLWPNFTEYRVVAPGALRTVLGERRVDVTPLTAAPHSVQGESKRLGVTTRRLELGSSLGSLKLEVGKVVDAGDGGPLLCRALVEIAGIDPKALVCQSGEVALSASYAWQNGGGVAFEVTSMTKRADLSPGDFVVPPGGVAYASAGLPEAPSGIFLSREELAGFRTSAIPLAAPKDPGAPGEGFTAVNQTDTLTYLLLDGVPVVAVPAMSERYLIGTARGRYVAEWRTFLGDRIGPPQTVELPARLVHGGGPDAGAPHTGPDGG